MAKVTSLRPPNSLVFLSDLGGGHPPLPIWGAQILSTSSCISIACYPEQDGPTEISIGTRDDVDSGVSPTFEAKLETPNRVVVVTTVDDKTVLEMGVASERTYVSVWLSHPRWPEKVTIGLG